MKKILIVIALLIFLVGALDVYRVNETMSDKAFSAVNTATHPGDPGYVSTVNIAQAIGEYWYLIIVAILLFIIMLEG